MKPSSFKIYQVVFRYFCYQFSVSKFVSCNGIKPIGCFSKDNTFQVTCPGVWLCSKSKVALSFKLFGIIKHSKFVPPQFPLRFEQTLTFSKVSNQLIGTYVWPIFYIIWFPLVWCDVVIITTYRCTYIFLFVFNIHTFLRLNDIMFFCSGRTVIQLKNVQIVTNVER